MSAGPSNIPLAETTSVVPTVGDESSAHARAAPLQEVDFWWGAYAGRTMLPGFIAWGIVSFVIVLAALYMWRVVGMDPYAVRYSTYGLLGLIWFVQLGLWLFRILTLNYRLTNRRLLIERSFRYSPFQKIELTRILHVAVGQSASQRWVGVGSVRVKTQNEDVVLEGIKDPERIAGKIRDLVAKATARGAKR